MIGSEWFVYILECSDDTYYTGITNNIIKRFKAHSSGKGAKYTASRIPLTLVWFKTVKDHSTAAKEEYRIKKMPRIEKEKLVAGDYS